MVSAAVSTKISSKDQGSFDVDEFTNKDTASVGHADTRLKNASVDDRLRVRLPNLHSDPV